jgi:hypothetical protein
LKRSLSVAGTCTAAALLAGMLAGCGVFGGGSSHQTALPSAVASTSSGPVAVASLSPTPTGPNTAPTPAAVAGYTLTASTPAVQRKFETVAGQFPGTFSGLTVRSVAKGNQVTGTLVLLGLHPQLVGNTTVEEHLVPGMVKGMSGQGAKVTTQKVGGQNVAVATTKTTSIVVWYRAGVMTMVLGNAADPAPSLAFTQAYLAAR